MLTVEFANVSFRSHFGNLGGHRILSASVSGVGCFNILALFVGIEATILRKVAPMATAAKGKKTPAPAVDPEDCVSWRPARFD